MELIPNLAADPLAMISTACEVIEANSGSSLPCICSGDEGCNCEDCEECQGDEESPG